MHKFNTGQEITWETILEYPLMSNIRAERLVETFEGGFGRFFSEKWWYWYQAVQQVVYRYRRMLAGGLPFQVHLRCTPWYSSSWCSHRILCFIIVKWQARRIYGCYCIAFEEIYSEESSEINWKQWGEVFCGGSCFSHPWSFFEKISKLSRLLANVLWTLLSHCINTSMGRPQIGNQE